MAAETSRSITVSISDKLKFLLNSRVFASRGSPRWPFVPGRYHVVDDTAPVIIVLPDDDELAESLAALSIQGLCMIAACCRNASDVEKLTRNIEANLAVHCVLLAGGEAGRDYPAVEALCAIFGDEQDISDKAQRIAHAARGKLRAIEFAALQKRVNIVNMLDCVEIDKIVAAVIKCGSEGQRPDAGFVAQGPDTIPGIPRIIAPTSISHEYQTDKAGKFIIGTDRKSITVEHYNSKGELMRLIQGATARDLCVMLVRNGWVSRLDHAAWLGRELALAELAVQQGIPYARKAETPDET